MIRKNSNAERYYEKNHKDVDDLFNQMMEKMPELDEIIKERKKRSNEYHKEYKKRMNGL